MDYKQTFDSITLIYFISVGLFILSIVSLIVHHKLKKKGVEFEQIRWVGFSVGVLIVSSIVVILPLLARVYFISSGITFKSSNNQYDKIINWPVQSYHNSDWFEMDGVKYIDFTSYFTDETNVYAYEYSEGEAVAIIRYPETKLNIFNKCLQLFIYGKSDDYYSENILYRVKINDSLEVYEINCYSHCGLYVPATEAELWAEYYNNSVNYDLDNVECVESVFTRNANNEKQITKYVEMDPMFFQQLSHEIINDGETIHIETPDIGYERRNITVYNEQKNFRIDLDLLLIDGQVYRLPLATYVYSEEISGIPLPNTLNRYIIETVFIE